MPSFFPNKAVLLLLVGKLMVFAASGQQKQVAITLDDAPFSAWGKNVSFEGMDSANQQLLATIDAYQLPVAVFFNEKEVVEGAKPDRRRAVLAKWLQHPLVTPGNHSYSHTNYAKTAYAAYEEEVVKGEKLMRELLGKSGKPLIYFRFPYNALGKDSLHQAQMAHFLQQKGYTVTPFTIESADYMYNALYVKALQEQQPQKAAAIAEAYVTATLKSFQYFEQLSLKLWGRPVKQIYLCHANQLNADYLPQLLGRLKTEGWDFISLDEAMTDPLYCTPLSYVGPYGFSWHYRWVKDPARRRELLINSPGPDAALWKEYEQQLR